MTPRTRRRPPKCKLRPAPPASLLGDLLQFLARSDNVKVRKWANRLRAAEPAPSTRT
ncbi:MAG TPA: hypothetical protein VKE74_23045 [Gemmataceae bacterium]|nr:hypothetical protein [Gemmataceae bacterium]